MRIVLNGYALSLQVPVVLQGDVASELEARASCLDKICLETVILGYAQATRQMPSVIHRWNVRSMSIMSWAAHVPTRYHREHISARDTHYLARVVTLCSDKRKN